MTASSMTTISQDPVGTKRSRGARRKLWIGLAVVLALAIGLWGVRAYRLLAPFAGGEAVDIGDGRTIFLKCSGSGSPTVILEHGLGATGADWATVQDAIDDTTRVCFTSRAGMALSDRIPGDGARTTQDAADDLAAVLAAAEVPGPYVLVGHSAGGFVVRLFAHQHPNDVVGMVLVDSSHEDQIVRTRQQLSDESWRQASGFFTGTNNAERMDLEASAAEVAAIGDLGDLPLVVLEAGDQDEDEAPPGISQATVDEVNAVTSSLSPLLQRDLARLSTDSTYIVVEDSGHFIQLDRPDAVVDAISSVVGR